MLLLEGLLRLHRLLLDGLRLLSRRLLRLSGVGSRSLLRIWCIRLVSSISSLWNYTIATRNYLLRLLLRLLGPLRWTTPVALLTRAGGGRRIWASNTLRTWGRSRATWVATRCRTGIRINIVSCLGRWLLLLRTPSVGLRPSGSWSRCGYILGATSIA